MAGRFLILQSQTAHALPLSGKVMKSMQRLADLPGLSIFVDGDTPVLMSEGQYDVIIGHLFTREGRAKAVDRLAANVFDDIRETRGQALIDRYWGGYCYFQIEAGHHVTCIVRDPSGTMPCYWWETPNTLLFASDADLLVAAASARPDIDWPALHRHLQAIDLRDRETCLSGVTELMPGERLELSDGTTRIEVCWSPWDHVAPRVRPTSDVLRGAIDDCVSAWSSVFGNILLTVSGGLDSSICTAALRDTRTLVTCLTMTTDEAEGDESPYARLLARSFQRQLIESRHQFEDIDLGRSASTHLPRPVNYALCQSELRERRALIDAKGFDVVFTGVGGDNVFCHLRSAVPVVDRLKREGPLAAWQTMLDLCVITDASLGEVGRAAYECLRRGGAAYPWHLDRRYLACSLPDRHLGHDWLVTPKGALAGQSVHIAMLLRLQATTDGFDRAAWPLQINPLTSQPIMELCLRIPSWQWCRGGRDRAVAREAYGQILPPKLINRRSKGGANSFAHQLVSGHRTELHALLCDGLLAAQNVVDADAISEALAPNRAIPFTEHLRLLTLAEAESWARHWTARQAS